MNAYYLLVWMEDSGCWWTADECEEQSRRGRNASRQKPETVPPR